MKKITVIGGGISGLSAACYLAKEGYDVSLYEKNKIVGGRAGLIEKDGFKFDTGPTFYWMPGIFEKFFNDFGKRVSDYYNLIRLDPGYEIYFGVEESVKISARLEKIFETFEQIEPGSSKYLKSFLKQAEYNYRIAIDKVVEKPGKSPLELIMPETIANVTEFLSSISSSVRKNIKSEKLRQVLEFPVIFLGAKPSDTPLFYRFMNYADMVLGTWHIEGGFHMLPLAMKELAQSLGVKFFTETHVDKIIVEKGKVTSFKYTNLKTEEKITEQTDFIVSSADYHFSETLLDKEYRNYSEKYWANRIFAPSALLFYVAFDTKLKNISHHTLFFDADFTKHAQTIYDTPRWPDKPLFYGSFPSITDASLAPQGKECGIFLIPVAAGLKDNETLRETYFIQLMNRMEELTGQEIIKHILFKESYSVKEFTEDFHSYKGNAYGLANILTQTAFLKPKMENKRIPNLLYTGQLTVPGPGVPPSIISGRIAARLAIKKIKNG